MIAAVALYLGLRQSPEEPVAARPNPERAAAIAQAAKQPSVVDYARLDQRLNLLMEERDMVGLAVGVVEGGQIRFLKGYGETVEGNGQAVNPATLFRWASVSKGVAGAMVAKLADQNKVGLYEPIAKYSMSLRLPGGAEHRATVADVLSHRLGPVRPCPGQQAGRRHGRARAAHEPGHAQPHLPARHLPCLSECRL
jgi:beta-lactamase class C